MSWGESFIIVSIYGGVFFVGLVGLFWFYWLFVWFECWVLWLGCFKLLVMGLLLIMIGLLLLLSLLVWLGEWVVSDEFGLWMIGLEVVCEGENDVN